MTSNNNNNNMSCTLFVAEVRGSRRCSVCRCDISEHTTNAIFVTPERIFSSLPAPNPSPFPISSSSRQSPRMSSTNPVAMSENSAFTIYSPDSKQLTPASDHVIIRPEPRFALAPILPRQEGSDSNISKRIRSKRRERPRSVGLLDLGSFHRLALLGGEEEEEEEHAEQQEEDAERPEAEKRSKDFKRILQRFQSAESKTSMSPPVGWSQKAGGGSQESWSTPNRSSLNSNYRESPVGSRNTSARSRLSVSSVTQSPHCFLPTTRDSSPRSIPSPSMVPLRPDSDGSPDITFNELHHSPLSHTGSTPDPTPPTMQSSPVKVPARRASYTPGYSPHEMFATRWVKETDVDDPLSLPTMSPIGSSSGGLSDVHHNHNHSHQIILPTLRSAPMSKMPSIEKLDNVAFRNSPSIRGYTNRNCRRNVLDQRAPNQSPNGIYVRRSRSKDDRPSLSYMSFDHQQQDLPSRALFMSAESIAHSSVQSPMTSPVNLITTITPTVQSNRQSSNNLQSDESHKHFQQISMSHVHTLNIVADKLSEDSRRGDEPVSRNRLAQLDFTSFIITSPHPILTKGKSLFYNGLLPRQGLPDYPVTLMIAPCSQYAPLMRKSESNHFGLPGFLEVEDHDGAIRQFLFDTETQNLDGRNTKVIAMPRLNLCSFHSLAAHQLNQRMDRTHHEELVSFILLQLLSALKMLQGEGVESLSTNFKEFLLAYRYQTSLNEFPRLLFLPETLGAEIESGGDELVGLCRYALRALCTLLHHKMDGKAPSIRLRSRFSRALSACALLLHEDKSSSLTKAKNVLELTLWSSGEHFKTDQEARAWIDTARAECVDNLVRLLINEPSRNLGARERFRIEFLLAATPRSIMEAQKSTLTANVN